MDLSTEIFITATTDLETILDYLEINQVLEDQIQLANYGSGVHEIVYKAIVYSRPSKIETPSHFFDPKDGTLTGSSIIDYQTLKHSNILDGTKLLVNGLFDLIDKYSAKISDFDFESLKQDISEIIKSYELPYEG